MNSTAAFCPMASPPPSAIRTRSPMCSAPPASQFFLESALETIMDIRVQLSSCVPATASRNLRRRPADRAPPALPRPSEGHRPCRIHEFPRRHPQGSDLHGQARAFQGGHIDGHAPLLSGYDLNGYLAAGIRTEHECTTAAEALEKIRKGMHILDPRRLGLQGPRMRCCPSSPSGSHPSSRFAPTTAIRSISPNRAISIT